MAVDAKICGLTRRGDVALAVEHGAWRLGVIFAGGPRTVTPAVAERLVAAAGATPVIGVFGSTPVAEILRLAASIGLRGAQLHGRYSVDEATRLHDEGLEVWRVAALSPDQDPATTVRESGQSADILLLEPRHPDGRGGKGVALDLAVARAARRAATGGRVALAGGLRPDTLLEAIRVVGPDAVDVSSGVESAPGIKDPAKLIRFLELARDAHVTT